MGSERDNNCPATPMLAVQRDEQHLLRQRVELLLPMVLATTLERAMTLTKLRELAIAAKAWRPSGDCVNAKAEVGAYRCSEGRHIYDAEDDDGTFCWVPVPVEKWCPACLGAQRAVEDIARLVDESALELEQTWWCPAHGEYVQPDAVTYEERHDPRAGGCGGSVELLGTRRIECAEDASRIASYFGPPGDVEAFAAAVREMCNG